MRRLIFTCCACLVAAFALETKAEGFGGGESGLSLPEREGSAALLLFPPMPDLPNPFSPGFGRGPTGGNAGGALLFDVRLAAHRGERLPELGLDVSLGHRAAALSGVERLTLMLRAGGDLDEGERLTRWRASAGAAAAEGPVSVGAGFAFTSETEAKPAELYGGLSIRLNF